MIYGLKKKKTSGMSSCFIFTLKNSQVSKYNFYLYGKLRLVLLKEEKWTDYYQTHARRPNGVSALTTSKYVITDIPEREINKM